MDYGTLPPEIGSARTFSGLCPGSLLAAAATWQRLADRLRDTATKYLITAGLLDGLRGPGAVQMGATTAPYITWLRATAELAEQTAARARRGRRRVRAGAPRLTDGPVADFTLEPARSGGRETHTGL